MGGFDDGSLRITQVLAHNCDPESKKETTVLLNSEDNDIMDKYSHFVPHYTEITTSLTSLLAKGTKWRWSEIEQEAFRKLKESSVSAPRLCPPLPGKTFNLQTDASEVGVGAVLFQREESGDRKIISYASKKLNPAQGRYSTVERECLAIVRAVDRFRPYLESGKFMLFIDNTPLRWLQQARCTNSKLTRWVLQLGAFDFEIRHVPGVENEAADALSRCPVVPNTVDEESLENNIHDPPWAAIQPKGDDGNVTLQVIVAKLSGDGARFDCLQKLYVIRDKVLYRHPRSIANWEEGVVVPADKAQIFLHRFHDHEVANHPWWKKSYRSVQSRFIWAGMREAVQKRKPEDRMYTRVPRQPWEVLSIDLMGPYPRTQRDKITILVVTDCYSRWVEAYSLGIDQIDSHHLWDFYLPHVLFSSPVKMMFGREIEAPGDWQLKLAEEHIRTLRRVTRLFPAPKPPVPITPRIPGKRQSANKGLGKHKAHPQSSAEKRFHAWFVPKWLGPVKFGELSRLPPTYEPEGKHLTKLHVSVMKRAMAERTNNPPPNRNNRSSRGIIATHVEKLLTMAGQLLRETRRLSGDGPEDTGRRSTRANTPQPEAARTLAGPPGRVPPRQVAPAYQRHDVRDRRGWFHPQPPASQPTQQPAMQLQAQQPALLPDPQHINVLYINYHNKSLCDINRACRLHYHSQTFLHLQLFPSKFTVNWSYENSSGKLVVWKISRLKNNMYIRLPSPSRLDSPLHLTVIFLFFFLIYSMKQITQFNNFKKLPIMKAITKISLHLSLLLIAINPRLNCAYYGYLKNLIQTSLELIPSRDEYSIDILTNFHTGYRTWTNGIQMKRISDLFKETITVTHYSNHKKKLPGRRASAAYTVPNTGHFSGLRIDIYYALSLSNREVYTIIQRPRHKYMPNVSVVARRPNVQLQFAGNKTRQLPNLNYLEVSDEIWMSMRSTIDRQHNSTTRTCRPQSSKFELFYIGAALINLIDQWTNHHHYYSLRLVHLMFKCSMINKMKKLETLFDTIEQIILNAIYFKMSLCTIFMPRTKATSYFEFCFVYKYLIIKILFIVKSIYSQN
ncbi:hypothetical protein QTP88_007108 [Uroleucon formosanum]